MPYVFLQWNKMRLEKGDIQRMAEFDNKNARRAQFSAQVRGLMLKLLVIWFVVSFGFGILMVEPLNEIRLGGYKLGCLLYTSPSPRDRTRSRMPSSA